MILIISIYEIPDSKRNDEINFVLNNNIANYHFKKIIILAEDFSIEAYKEKEKIEIVPLNRRPTFNDFLKHCVKDEINIIANNDIIFDDTVKFIKKLVSKESRISLALSRWEPNGTIFRERFSDSQDAWAIWSNFEQEVLISDYFMGIPGCDNRFAHDLEYIYKRRVFNPSKVIKIVHHHKSQQRTYKKTDQLKGSYLLIRPTGLLEVYIIKYFGFIKRYYKWSFVRI